MTILQELDHGAAQAAIDATIHSRMSARAFTPQPVPRDVILRLLELASRAPSGTNIQPWKAYVLVGVRSCRTSWSARARGLQTCPQVAWNSFAKVVLPHIGAGPEEMLVCGMSLGYADESEKVNSFRTPRVPADQFTTWLE